MHVQSDHTHLLHNSHWVVKLSSVVSVLVKWKFGHLKHSVQQTFCRKLLTVKSDDVIGRAKAYEAIVKGENMPTPGIPESFNVLLHELRGLGLKITLIKNKVKVMRNFMNLNLQKH